MNSSGRKLRESIVDLDNLIKKVNYTYKEDGIEYDSIEMLIKRFKEDLKTYPKTP